MPFMFDGVADCKQVSSREIPWDTRCRHCLVAVSRSAPLRWSASLRRSASPPGLSHFAGRCCRRVATMGSATAATGALTEEAVWAAWDEWAASQPPGSAAPEAEDHATDPSVDKQFQDLEKWTLCLHILDDLLNRTRKFPLPASATLGEAPLLPVPPLPDNHMFLPPLDDDQAAFISKGAGHGRQGAGTGSQCAGHGSQGAGHGRQGVGIGSQCAGNGSQVVGHGTQGDEHSGEESSDQSWHGTESLERVLDEAEDIEDSEKEGGEDEQEGGEDEEEEQDGDDSGESSEIDWDTHVQCPFCMRIIPIPDDMHCSECGADLRCEHER